MPEDNVLFATYLLRLPLHIRRLNVKYKSMVLNLTDDNIIYINEDETDFDFDKPAHVVYVDEFASNDWYNLLDKNDIEFQVKIEILNIYDINNKLIDHKEWSKYGFVSN